MKQSLSIVRRLIRSYQKSAVIFTVLGVMAFSFLMTYLFYYMNIKTYETESLKTVNRFIEKELHFEINEILDKPEKHAGLSSHIDLFIKTNNLVDFRIWNNDYRVMYSYSNKYFVGKHFRENEDLNKVYRTKRDVAKIEKFGESDEVNLPEEGTVFELYSPIMVNGKLAGVLEVYRLGPPLDFFAGVNLLVGFLTMVVPLILYLFINKHFSKAADTILDYHDILQVAYDKTTISYIDTVICLTRALEMRDMETEGHSERVVNMALFIGKRLDLSDQELGRLAIGAYLHDIGKIGIPDSVLLKPGALNEGERRIVEEHVCHGYNIIKDVKFLAQAKNVILYHHEKWDGTGYPKGLKGEDIPLNARIFALVDVFDALVSERPYKKEMPVEEALEIIRKGRGSHFDPEVADVLLNMNPEEVYEINRNINKEKIDAIVYESVTSLMGSIQYV